MSPVVFESWHLPAPGKVPETLITEGYHRLAGASHLLHSLYSWSRNLPLFSREEWLLEPSVHSSGAQTKETLPVRS